MSTYLLVGVGGVLGALARHLLGELLAGDRRDTLAVNVLGSFTLGALTGVLADGTTALLLFGTGFCGAFTTFSSFAFETVRLYEDGARREALGNATVNLVGALLAVLLGGLLAAGLT